ncbi:DUF362 domain-containing protein [Candidatus Latescibacterota bacterium]
MEMECCSHSGRSSRRSFIKQMSLGAAGLSLGSLGMTGCSTMMRTVAVGGRRVIREAGTSPVSFVTSKDQRDAAYQALKPIQRQIEREIGDKQVVIKINSGQIRKDWWLNATDPKFTAGILDFLKEFYDRQVIVAESTAAGAKSTMEGFENYGFMPLEKEFNVKFVDLNDGPATTQFILNDNRHPLAINIINTYLDPNVYMISATRLKTHNCVIATLSMKNITMGSPINHFKQKARKDRNEKPFMHSGGNRGLSYNLFRLATLGVQPDLAVLDGVVGMEGNGPVSGTEMRQGVAVASCDWLAADRLGVELMGMDYSEIKYLQWCADAGMGTDDLSKIKIIGPDYKNHIVKYKLSDNIEGQRKWIREDYKS